MKGTKTRRTRYYICSSFIQNLDFITCILFFTPYQNTNLKSSFFETSTMFIFSGIESHNPFHLNRLNNSVLVILVSKDSFCRLRPKKGFLRPEMKIVCGDSMIIDIGTCLSIRIIF